MKSILPQAINLIYLKNCDCNLEREVYAQLSKTYTKTSHTIKVDIPVPNKDGTLLINGSRKILKKQIKILIFFISCKKTLFLYIALYSLFT